MHFLPFIIIIIHNLYFTGLLRKFCFTKDSCMMTSVKQSWSRGTRAYKIKFDFQKDMVEIYKSLFFVFSRNNFIFHQEN